MTWVDLQKDDAHVRREREKGRILRKTPWWQRQCEAGICHYCKAHVGAAALTMDHVVPVARGGSSSKGNVVPACSACNRTKKIQIPAEQILEQLFGEMPPDVDDDHEAPGE